jgi:hypothetical protein
MGSGEPFSIHILSTLILEKVRKERYLGKVFEYKEMWCFDESRLYLYMFASVCTYYSFDI